MTHDVNPVLPVVDRVLYIARGQVAIGTADEIITTQKLSSLYEAPVEVVHDSLGRVFVVGLEELEGHLAMNVAWPIRTRLAFPSRTVAAS